MIPFVATLLASLFLGLEFGIVIGVGINLLFVLYNTSRPRLLVECVSVAGGQSVILVTPDQNLYFSAAEFVKSEVLRAVSLHPEANLVVIDGHYVNHMDATVATNLESLVSDCRLLSTVVLFWNWQPQPMGVAVRLTAEFKPLFKCAPSLEALVQQVQANPSEGITILPSSP